MSLMRRLYMFLSVQVFKVISSIVITCLISLMSMTAWSSEQKSSETIVPLHEQVQSLKKVVLELNRDLYL